MCAVLVGLSALLYATCALFYFGHPWIALIVVLGFLALSWIIISVLDRP